MEYLSILFWMLVAHAVCDYPLQGDFLAKAKNHKAPIPGIDWWIALGAHSLIHAGAVAFITGSFWIGVGEFIAHCLIDRAKCEGLTTFRTDQALHVACKLAWIGTLLWIAA
jgi:hypothetical protein